MSDLEASTMWASSCGRYFTGPLSQTSERKMAVSVDRRTDLDISTTAEGIESVELATALAALGCASGQGYYFAKPTGSGKNFLGLARSSHLAYPPQGDRRWDGA